MKKRIAINGFGRIGRLVFRLLSEHQELEVVAINDLTNVETLAHLLRFDSSQGTFKKEVKVEEKQECDNSCPVKAASKGKLVVEGNEVLVFAERDPSQLP